MSAATNQDLFKNRKFLAIIGDENTVSGMLLAGIGVCCINIFSLLFIYFCMLPLLPSPIFPEKLNLFNVVDFSNC